MLVGLGKRKRVEGLFAKLRKNDLARTDKLKALEELKVLGRAVDNADPIYTTKGITILSRYGFKDEDALVRREAQRCLANALFLKPLTRSIFAEVGGCDIFVMLFKGNVDKREAEDDFLLGRIGFLLTADKGEVVEQFVKEDHVLEDVSKVLTRYVELSAKRPLVGIHSSALAEILKFMFNLTFHVKVADNTESPLTPQLIALLLSLRKEAQPPLTNVVHGLLNLPLAHSQSVLFPSDYPTKIVQRIIDIVDRTIPEDTEGISNTSLDEDLSPFFALLSSIYEVAPSPVRDLMLQELLPTEEDRNLPLGQSQSLSSRLLRLVTNAFTPTLREAILSLIFQLVDSSPAGLVDAIGYGYASGYLFSHNIPIPENIRNPSRGRADINPITGQRLDAETIPDVVEMTDEEKEQEAEKLFVLFERMRNLGVGVDNPVRAFQQSGRFEELNE